MGPVHTCMSVGHFHKYMLFHKYTAVSSAYMAVSRALYNFMCMHTFTEPLKRPSIEKMCMDM